MISRVASGWVVAVNLKADFLGSIFAVKGTEASRVNSSLGEPEAAFAREVHELARGLDVHFHGAYAAAELDHLRHA